MSNTFWEGLGGSGRIGLIGGAALIVLASVLAGMWVLRTDYQVLFSDLTVQDSSALVAELEKQKIPYKLGDNGTSILVDRDTVHQTRLKVMGKNLPLHGAVGFELFNTSDFGMTEFAQKINYQRALQGELTRTILSMPEVREVRVHLALPEQGLFKQATNKAKAAIHLSLKQGQALRPEQVGGIQRLVAASVPGIAAQDVTIVDQHGVALTRISGTEGDNDFTSPRLDLKKETENYLSRKAGEVLEKAFGPGQALASVDVVLDMDQVRTTTEDVIAPPGRNGREQTGVVVREREVLRDSGAPLDTKTAAGGLRGNNSQREVEYQVGRRVEQVVHQPGSIRRIQVVALVRKKLDADQADQVKSLVAAAVGASPERGDTVVVQALDAPVVQNDQFGTAALGSGIASNTSSVTTNVPDLVLIILGLFLLVIIAMAVAWSTRRKRLSSNTALALSDPQRQLALQRVRGWLAEESVKTRGIS